MVREYDKLVRDKIPEITDQDDETPVVHTAGEGEYEQRLFDKLDEEVAEFRESGEVAELADVLEVVHAIRENIGISEERLAERRAEKAEERGRFEEGVVLERVE